MSQNLSFNSYGQHQISNTTLEKTPSTNLHHNYNQNNSLEKEKSIKINLKNQLYQGEHLQSKILEHAKNSKTTKSYTNQELKLLPNFDIKDSYGISGRDQPSHFSDKKQKYSAHILSEGRRGLQTSHQSQREAQDPLQIAIQSQKQNSKPITMHSLSIFHNDNQSKDKLSMEKTFKMTNKKISARFIEQWLNETLKECEDLDIPGSLSKPEHKLPLSRYSMDRMYLTNIGIPLHQVNRIYQSLFVYSVGFYALLDDCTKNLENDRIITQSKIWKVYQILLEYCCKTDYRLITQEIEKFNQQQADEAEGKFRDAIQKLEESETNLKNEVRRLQNQFDEITVEKNQERNEKSKIMKDFQNTSKKHEEEVQLRLFFESKLNSLHHLNREMTTKLKNFKLKYSHEVIKNQDLKDENKRLLDELDNIKSTNFNLNKELDESNIKLEFNMEDKLKIEQNLFQVKTKLHEENLKLDITTQNLDLITKEKEKLEMELQNYKNFVSSKTNEHQNIDSYLAQVSLRGEELEVTLSQYKMKEDRTRKKLQFYKSQYMGFELQRKTLEEENQIISQAMREANKKIQEQIGQIEELEQVKNDQVRDLENKLKDQINQTSSLVQKLEEANEEIKQLKQMQNRLEYNLTQSELEKTDVENQVTALEYKLETFEEKFDDTKTTLRLQANNEKMSRDEWKDRFDKENQALNMAQKNLNQAKGEVAELKIKLQTYDRQISDAKEQKEAFKMDRDNLHTKYNDACGLIEKLERELYTKRKILENFDKDKKNEIKELTKSLNEFERNQPRQQMHHEDILSELLRQKYLKLEIMEEKDKQDSKLKELQIKLETMKKSEDKFTQEKLELKTKIEEQGRIIFELKIAKEELESRFDGLNDQNKRYKWDIDGFMMIICDYEAQLDRLTQQYSKIQEENNLLKRDKLDIEDKEIQYSNNDCEAMVQTDLTFEKVSGRMVVYHQNGNQIEKMRTYSSREDFGDQDAQNSRKQLKPMFKKQSHGSSIGHSSGGGGSHKHTLSKGGISNNLNRPYTGFKSDLQIQEEDHEIGRSGTMQFGLKNKRVSMLGVDNQNDDFCSVVSSKTSKKSNGKNRIKTGFGCNRPHGSFLGHIAESEDLNQSYLSAFDNYGMKSGLGLGAGYLDPSGNYVKTEGVRDTNNQRINTASKQTNLSISDRGASAEPQMRKIDEVKIKRLLKNAYASNN
eukprot:403341020